MLSLSILASIAGGKKRYDEVVKLDVIYSSRCIGLITEGIRIAAMRSNQSRMIDWIEQLSRRPSGDSALG